VTKIRVSSSLSVAVVSLSGIGLLFSVMDPECGP
jgi:hypothetical protein